jgi:nucleotide-binding universal stress UspA family protein
MHVSHPTDIPYHPSQLPYPFGSHNPPSSLADKRIDKYLADVNEQRRWSCFMASPVLLQSHVPPPPTTAPPSPTTTGHQAALDLAQTNLTKARSDVAFAEENVLKEQRNLNKEERNLNKEELKLNLLETVVGKRRNLSADEYIALLGTTDAPNTEIIIGATTVEPFSMEKVELKVKEVKQYVEKAELKVEKAKQYVKDAKQEVEEAKQYVKEAELKAEKARQDLEIEKAKQDAKKAIILDEYRHLEVAMIMMGGWL